MIRVVIRQFVIRIQLGAIQAVSLVEISIDLVFPIPDLSAHGGDEKGAENDRHTPALVIGPTQQRFAVVLRSDRTAVLFKLPRFRAARL